MGCWDGLGDEKIDTDLVFKLKQLDSLVCIGTENKDKPLTRLQLSKFTHIPSLKLTNYQGLSCLINPSKIEVQNEMFTGGYVLVGGVLYLWTKPD